MIEARENGNIPDCINGEHRILQKQIDLIQVDVRYIRENIGCGIEANTRSKTNFKLFCLLLAGMITLTGAVVATGAF